MKLYQHNQEAYEKVMAHFGAGHKRAAVVHATGTGKSYVGGAIAEHFRNVLVLAPNIRILNQAVQNAPKARTMTYAYLALREGCDIPTGIDLIWFDEFHRMGAKTWQDGCQRLLDANPNAMVLGTTATKERHLEQRDMAEEFFQGDIVSELTLSDAWVRRILPVPVYVIGMVSIRETREDYASRISSSKHLGATERKKASEMLDNLVLDWSRSSGIPQIIKKYVNADIGRMVAFVPTIAKLEEVKGSLPVWFAEAGVWLSGLYAIHSAMPDSEADAQIKAFEADCSAGVKILLSVDMVSEGIHNENIDGVILFRSTASRNMYIQQIGRCFSVGHKRRPLILDMADNITSACGYDVIREARDRYVRETCHHASKHEGLSCDFEIVDTLKETRDLLEIMDSMVVRGGADERLEELTAWCVKNRRMPSRTNEGERHLAVWVAHHAQSDAVKALKKRFAPDSKRLIADFVQQYGRLPLPKDGGRLYSYIYTHQEDDEIKALCEQYGFSIKRKPTKEYNKGQYGKLVSFCRKQNRLPRRTQEEERELWRYMTNNRDNTMVLQLIGSYSSFRPGRRLAELESFIRKNNRMPKSKGEEYILYSCLVRVRKKGGEPYERIRRLISEP